MHDHDRAAGGLVDQLGWAGFARSGFAWTTGKALFCSALCRDWPAGLPERICRLSTQSLVQYVIMEGRG